MERNELENEVEDLESSIDSLKEYIKKLPLQFKEFIDRSGFYSKKTLWAYLIVVFVVSVILVLSK